MPTGPRRPLRAKYRTAHTHPGQALLGGYVASVHPLRRLQAFAERRPSLGPIVWQLSVQYFLVQAVVVAAWKPAYSWRLDAISDLGATRCGQFDGRYV